MSLDFRSVDIVEHMQRYLYLGNLNYISDRPESERIPLLRRTRQHWPRFTTPRTAGSTHLTWTRQRQLCSSTTTGAMTRAHVPVSTTSFRDKFHENWPQCPARRSIEVRFLLAFD